MDELHPLTAWRKSIGMSQTALAAKIGVGPSQISQVEAGLKGCSLEAAIKIRGLAGDAVPLESLLPAEAAQ